MLTGFVSAFRPNYDFYGHGGTYRSVRLHCLPPCAIDRVQVTPLDIGTGLLRLAVELELTVPNARMWSPEDPRLHVVEAGIRSDAIRERFGLRTIETGGADILLNGNGIRALPARSGNCGSPPTIVTPRSGAATGGRTSGR